MSALEELDKSISFMKMEIESTRQQYINLKNIGEEKLSKDLKKVCWDERKYYRGLLKERAKLK